MRPASRDTGDVIATGAAGLILQTGFWPLQAFCKAARDPCVAHSDPLPYIVAGS